MASSGTPQFDFATIDTVVAIQSQNQVIDPNGNTKQIKVNQELTLDQLHQRLFTDPTGLKEVRIDQTFDLTALGATFTPICVIPAGSKVKLAKLQILTAVTTASSGDSLGIGTHGTTPTLLLAGAANLTKNYQVGKVPADAASIIASQTTIDLCATVQSDGSISLGNITAGRVRVLLVYITPAVLDNV